ncbi:MAG: 4-(cytidine 5'-diphospho)-2-C-methyl-D-erythritol kinase [Candidatus Dormibacterales bacterium]
MTIALPARAKLNLGLEVIGSGADGYHEVRTTLQAIDLHDLLEVTPGDRTSLTISGLSVAGSAENTVLKAHAALERAAQRVMPTRFQLHKRIPPGSGMGGASSDAAAALRGLATIHGLDVDLNRLAGELGADVPFFVNGGTAVASGRGDVLTPMSTDSAWFAIAWPGVELSTAAVYRAWDEVGGEGPNHLRRAAERVEPRLQSFAASLEEGPWEMTGSGSAFFKRCDGREHAIRVTAGLTCWTAVSRAVGAW